MASNLSYLAAPVTSTASSILKSFFCAFINIHDAFWWGVGTSPVSCTDLRSRPQLMNINEAGWWRTQSELRSNIRVLFVFDSDYWCSVRELSLTPNSDLYRGCQSQWLTHTHKRRWRKWMFLYWNTVFLGCWFLIFRGRQTRWQGQTPRKVNLFEIRLAKSLSCQRKSEFQTIIFP